MRKQFSPQGGPPTVHSPHGRSATSHLLSPSRRLQPLSPLNAPASPEVALAGPLVQRKPPNGVPNNNTINHTVQSHAVGQAGQHGRSPSSPVGGRLQPMPQTLRGMVQPKAGGQQQSIPDKTLPAGHGVSPGASSGGDSPLSGGTFETSYHHQRFLAKRHQMVLGLQRDRVEEEARVESDRLTAKGLRRTEHSQQVDTFQRGIAEERALVADALARKEQSIQGLYFAQPFTVDSIIEGGSQANSGAGPSITPRGVALPSEGSTSRTPSPLVSPRSPPASTPRAGVPHVLPLLFRSEADRVSTMWVMERLRFCVGDMVTPIPVHTIPSDEERLTLAASAGGGSRPQSPIAFPPAKGPRGIVVGPGATPMDVSVVYGDGQASVSVPMDSLALVTNRLGGDLEGDALLEEEGEGEGEGEGVGCVYRADIEGDEAEEGDILDETRGYIESPSVTASASQLSPPTVSPFIITSKGVPLQLHAVDVVMEVTATAAVVSQVTRWRHSENYLSQTPHSPNTTEAIQAIVPVVEGCQLVSIVADFGRGGVCESMVMGPDEACATFKRAPEAASSPDTQQFVLPIGEVYLEEYVTLKLVYHAAVSTVVPVGPASSHNTPSGDAQPHHPFMLEVRFPINFPSRVFPCGVSFHEMADFTFVLFGVSHWGFLGESYPRLQVKRCHNFQGPRAQYTIARKEPWSGEDWANGNDLVVRFGYNIPQGPHNSITMPNQIIKDNLHTGFVLTEPYLATSSRATTAIVFVVPSYEPQPDSAYFRRKLHVCIDTSYFLMGELSPAVARSRRGEAASSVSVSVDKSGRRSVAASSTAEVSLQGNAKATGGGSESDGEEAPLTATVAGGGTSLGRSSAVVLLDDSEDVSVPGLDGKRARGVRRGSMGRPRRPPRPPRLGDLPHGAHRSEGSFPAGDGDCVSEGDDDADDGALRTPEALLLRQHVLLALRQALASLRGGDLVSISCFDSVSGIIAHRGDTADLATPHTMNNFATSSPLSRQDANPAHSGHRPPTGSGHSVMTGSPPQRNNSRTSSTVAGAPQGEGAITVTRKRSSCPGVVTSGAATSVATPTSSGVTREFLGSYRGMALSQQLQPAQGAYAVPNDGDDHAVWCDAVVRDTVGLFASNAPADVMLYRGTLLDMYKRAFESVAEHPTEKAYVTDVVRDIVILGFSEVSLDQQEAVARFVNNETRAVRTHSVYCPLVGSPLATLTNTFYAGMADKTRGGSVFLPARVATDGQYLRGVGAIMPFIAPCVMVDLAFQFSGPTRVDGSFTSALGGKQSLAQFVSMAGDVLSGDGVSMSYRLTRNRRMTKLLSSTRTSIPLALHAAQLLTQKTLAMLLWRSVLSSAAAPPSQWLLPVLRRATAAGIPYTISDVVAACHGHSGSKGMGGRRGSHVSSVGGGASPHKDNVASILDSTTNGLYTSSGGFSNLYADAFVSTNLCVLSRRRTSNEQVITQGSDMLPISIATGLFGGTRGVNSGGVDGPKPLLIKPPPSRLDLSQPSTALLSAVTIPSQIILESRSRRASSFGKGSLGLGDGGHSLSRCSSSVSANSHSQERVYDPLLRRASRETAHDEDAEEEAAARNLSLLRWVTHVITEGSLRQVQVQEDESAARYLLERLWWEAVLETYEGYCTRRSHEQDKALVLLSGLAEVEREHTVAMEELGDAEEEAWRTLLVRTEPMRMLIGRVNNSFGDVRRRLLYGEEDGRLLIEADQQKLATVAALVVASLGRMCLHGQELRQVYPHVAPGIVHGDGSNNVHYLLGVIDAFHDDPRAIAFLKVASTVWSTRDYSTSKLLGSDGGVAKCKDMLHAFMHMEDVVSSVLSTVATISAIRANYAKLCQSGIIRDVVAVMRTYPQGRATQLAAAKALARLTPLDPSLLPRCAQGMEVLLNRFGRFCSSPFYTQDVLSILVSVTGATPQAHMLVADYGLPIIGAALLRLFPRDSDMLRAYLEVCTAVASSQPLRAVMVSDRWVPRVACHVLGSSAFGLGIKHKALNALRKLAGNVMERSSILMSTFVCPILTDCIAKASDEQLIAEMRTLRKRLMLKHDSLSINSDGSHVVVPKSTHDRYAALLPPSIASCLLPMDAIRFMGTPIEVSSAGGGHRSSSSPHCLYGMCTPCVFKCPATGVETNAQARTFSTSGLAQYLLGLSAEGGPRSTATEADLAGLQSAAMAMLLADVQANNNPPLSFMPRCLGLSIGDDGNDRLFCAVFESMPIIDGPIRGPAEALGPYLAKARKGLKSLAVPPPQQVGGSASSFRVPVVQFPIHLFIGLAESLFDALVVMRTMGIRHRGISTDNGVRVSMGGGGDDAGASGQAVSVEVCCHSSTSDAAHSLHYGLGGSRFEYVVDPITCAVTHSPAEEGTEAASFAVPVFRDDGSLAAPALFETSMLMRSRPSQSPAAPSSELSVSIVLPTVSLSSEAVLAEVEEYLPSFDRQCLVQRADLEALRRECGLVVPSGGGSPSLVACAADSYTMDAMCARVVLLDVLAFGGAGRSNWRRAKAGQGVTLEALCHYVDSVATAPPAAPRIAAEVLQIHWLLQKLPRDVRDLIFGVRAPDGPQLGSINCDLFANSVSEVWEGLARIRRAMA